MKNVTKTGRGIIFFLLIVIGAIIIDCTDMLVLPILLIVIGFGCLLVNYLEG